MYIPLTDQLDYQETKVASFWLEKIVTPSTFVTRQFYQLESLILKRSAIYFDILFLLWCSEFFETVMQCIPVDKIEWGKKLEAHNQKLPSSIDLLSHIECQKLEIEGVSYKKLIYILVDLKLGLSLSFGFLWMQSYEPYCMLVYLPLCEGLVNCFYIRF